MATFETTTLIADTPQVVVGLGTLTYTAPTTGLYTIRVQQDDLPPSGMSIVVNDNGSPIFTAPILGEIQISIQLALTKSFTANHVITIVLSSSDENDLLLNSVKTRVSIGAGF